MNKNSQGFTLVELILYLAIVSVIFSALVPFAWNVIEGGVKSGVEQEVTNNAWFIMEKIKGKIRNAPDILSVSSDSITLLNPNGPNTIIDIDLPSGNVRLKEGTTINLNSADTTVTSLIFTDLRSGDGKTKQIQIEMTISSALNQTRSEYIESVSLRSGVEVRGI